MADHDCGDILEELQEFISGELTPVNRARIEGHLDDCPPCLDAFDFEADLRKVIANRCHDEVPQDLRQRIAEAIEAE